MVKKDPYQVLGVEEDASEEEIRAAYKRLAKKYHPDVAEMDKGEAEDRFKDISWAYDVLSDTDKRKQYEKDRKFGGFQRPAYDWEYQPYMDGYTWFPRMRREWNEHHDVMYG